MSKFGNIVIGAEIVEHPILARYDYVASGLPQSDTNPDHLYASWLDLDTGEVWTCTSNIRNSNIWTSNIGNETGGPYLLFKGSTRVTFPIAAFGTSSTLKTWEFWLWQNFEGTGGNNSLFYAKDANGYKVAGIHLPWTSHTYYFDAGNSGTSSYDRINSTFADETSYSGAWLHFAYTKNATTGNMKIYRNGVLIHSGTGKTRTFPAVTDYYIGSSYEGFIRDFRTWDTERTITQIQDNMGETLTGAESGLVSLYPLNEGGGTVANELVSGNDGTITNEHWSDPERRAA